MRDGEIIERRFVVLRTLQQDEHGAVAVGTDKSTRAPVLVETLNVSASHALRPLAERLCTLSHPLLPRVMAHFRSAECLTLILETRDGPTLDQIAALPGDEGESLDVARACMPLVDYLHGQSPAVTGLNLGPENLVQRGSGVVLRSFGLRARQSEGESLGRTLYVLLTGAQASTAVPLASARPDLPAATVAMVEGLRSGRSDALNLLRAALSGSTAASDPPASWLPADRPVPGPPPQEWPIKPFLPGRKSESAFPPPVPLSPPPAPMAPAPLSPPPAPVRQRASTTRDMEVPPAVRQGGKPGPPSGLPDLGATLLPEVVPKPAPRAPAATKSPNGTPPRAGTTRSMDVPDEVRQASTDSSAGSPLLDGRYRRERVLGEGGMGAVYLATDLHSGAAVAIKEMRPTASDPETRNRCLRQFGVEASMLNHLDHPSLPRIHDFFADGDHHYLVMEYIDGVTLEQAPVADESLLLSWAGYLCDVLEYLHGQTPPVVFRDLKPANIMLASDGNLRLIDFGIAHVFDPDRTVDMMDGPGSHGYAAPEQYSTGGGDVRVDIYALGAVLYYLLVRTDPPSSMDLLISTADLIPSRVARPDISERIHSAVEWMMSLARDMRPLTVEQCRQVLGLSDTIISADNTPPARMRRLLREEFHTLFPGPWIERGTLVDTLKSRLTGSEPRILVRLSGETGSGKSRLLDEVGRQTNDDARLLPRIRGYRATAHQPARALITPMHMLLRQEGPLVASTLASRLDTVSLQAMMHMFPPLSNHLSVRPESSAPPLPALERARVLIKAFREVIEALAQASNQRPVLVLDNAHWLDGATLRLIDSLLSGDLPRGLALVASVSTDEPGGELLDALPRWARFTPIVDIAVPPFTAAETQAYFDTALPPIADLEWHMEALHRATRGNPMLLEELIRVLVLRKALEARNGALLLRQVSVDQLPSSLVDSVLYRIEALPTLAQDLLSMASVVGPSFSTEVLEKVSGQDPEQLGHCLARAQEAAFLRPGLDTDWEFVNDATHTAFHQRLAADVRARLETNLDAFESAHHQEQLANLPKAKSPAPPEGPIPSERGPAEAALDTGPAASAPVTDSGPGPSPSPPDPAKAHLQETLRDTVSARDISMRETTAQNLDIAWLWLGPQEQQEEMQRLAVLARRLDRPLLAYLDERPELLLVDLESPQHERRVAAAMGLIRQGLRARTMLLDYLTTREDGIGRSVALFVLSQMVDDVAGLLLSRIIEAGSEVVAGRLLRALQEARLPWEPVVEELLCCPWADVRRAAARCILDAALSTQAKESMLRKAMSSESARVVCDALDAAGDLGSTGLRTDIAQVLERKWIDPADATCVQVRACHALPGLGTPEEVLPLLRAVATGSPAGSTGQVRAAATWAIGRLVSQEGQALLRQLLQDGDPEVSGAARLALATPIPQEKPTPALAATDVP